MYETKDLRIGNYLARRDGSIFPVTVDDIMNINKFPPYLRPIPVILSEELIIEMGGQQYPERKDLYKLDKFVLVMDEDGDVGIVTGNFVCELSLCHLKYVHQLQNLYFALTGEESIYNK